MSVVQVLIEENAPISTLDVDIDKCPACTVNAATVPVVIGKVEYLLCVPCTARKVL